MKKRDGLGSSIVEHFQDVKDPRINRRKRHYLSILSSSVLWPSYAIAKAGKISKNSQ